MFRSQAILVVAFLVEHVLTAYVCPEYCHYKLAGVKSTIRHRVRKDIKCLTEKEWQDFAEACQKVHRSGVWDSFNEIHVKNFELAHDRAEFFPWHRWFLYQIERALKAYNPKVTIPYWDAAADFAAPETSVVLTPQRAGTNGDPLSGHCLKDGVSGNWIRQYPEVKCVRRQWAGDADTVGPWHSPEWMTHLFQTSESYDHFREGVEQSLHILMHNNIGGAIGDLANPQSMSDIIFLLIHSNVDRIWAKWQRAHPKHLYAYDGPYFDRETNITLDTASLDDPIAFYNIKVRELMEIDNSRLPYTYDEFLSPEVTMSASKREAFGQLSKLPPAILKKFYPKFYSGNHNFYLSEFPPSCKSRKVARPMPLPTQIVESDIRIDAWRLYMVQNASNLLVNTLNSNIYASPYL